MSGNVRGSEQELGQGPLSHAPGVRVPADPSPQWRVRAVTELDATADKCLFFWDEAMTRRACGHVDGDPECLATRLDANDDEAHRQAQLFFTGEAVPCPVCGVYAVCDCLDGEP